MRHVLLGLALVLSTSAVADIVPPHPPSRGTVPQDLPPPGAVATSTPWMPFAAGGFVVLGVAGVLFVGRTRREAP